MSRADAIALKVVFLAIVGAVLFSFGPWIGVAVLMFGWWIPLVILVLWLNFWFLHGVFRWVLR